MKYTQSTLDKLEKIAGEQVMSFAMKGGLFKAVIAYLNRRRL